MRPVSAATVSSIAILPSTATITADQTQAIKVIATNTDGTTLDVTPAATLSSNDALGTITNAVFTPGVAGTWTIQAAYQSFTATATIQITAGQVQEIVINPNSDPEPTVIGSNKTFTAKVYDGHNDIIPGATVTWSVIGTIGTISTSGVFAPTTVGTGKVQATVGTITGQVGVVVASTPATNTNIAMTNGNVNSNTAASTTNTSVNTNMTKPTNGNVNTNIAITNNNLNATTNAAVTNLQSASTSTDKSCSTLKPWVWIVLLIVFLIVVALLYTLVPIIQIWPAIVALAGAALLAYIQRKYGCGGQTWWAWVVTLGTLAFSAAAMKLQPKHPIQ